MNSQIVEMVARLTPLREELDFLLSRGKPTEERLKEAREDLLHDLADAVSDSIRLLNRLQGPEKP